jgi:hypothetical protein
MKNHLTLFFFICCYANLFSQQTSFPITYDLNLNSIKDRSDHRNNPEETLYSEIYKDQGGSRENKTITYTKFYPDMMEQLLENFIKHIEVNKTVKNYDENTYYSGIWKLNRGYIKDLNDPNKYKKWGGYYLNLASNDMVWENGVARGKHQYGEISIGYEGTFYCDLVNQIQSWPPYDVFDTIICTPSGSEFIAGMGFLEFWNFDAQKGTFTKDVQMLSLREFKLDNNTGELRGISTPLIFKSTSGIDHTNLFKRNMKYDVFFDSWNLCLPESNSGCEDLKNEMGAGMSTRNNIQPLIKQELLAGMMHAVQAGDLIALDAWAYDEKEEKILSMEEVYNCMNQYDTTQILYPYPPYEGLDTVFVTYLGLDEIVGIRFIEDWYFEPTTFNFYKKVKAFGLLSAVYSNYTGELMGYKTMFYLKPTNQ